MTKELASMYSDFVRDALVEGAVKAAAKLASHLGDDPQADAAWKACFALKALRRQEVVQRLDAARLAEVRA